MSAWGFVDGLAASRLFKLAEAFSAESGRWSQKGRMYGSGLIRGIMGPSSLGLRARRQPIRLLDAPLKYLKYRSTIGSATLNSKR